MHCSSGIVTVAVTALGPAGLCVLYYSSRRLVRELLQGGVGAGDVLAPARLPAAPAWPYF